MLATKQTEHQEEFQLLALEEVEKFAEEHMLALQDGEIMEWQMMFALARRLLTLEDAGRFDVCLLRPVVERLCEILIDAGWGEYRDFSDIEMRWLDFVRAWQIIEYPEGEGPLEAAFERAQRAPVTPKSPFSTDYVLLVSTAYYLQRMLDPDPIVLPVERVGALFGRNKMYGSRLIALAIEEGLLAVVAEHRRFQRLARTVRFKFDSDAYTPPEVPADVTRPRELRRRLYAG